MKFLHYLFTYLILLNFSATPFSWAQRRDNLYITVPLRDIKDEHIELLANSLTFNCTSDEKNYTGTVNFFDEIDVEVNNIPNENMLKEE